MFYQTDTPFKAKSVTYYAKKLASAKITFQSIEFGPGIPPIGERFLLTGKYAIHPRQLPSWGGRTVRMAPTRRLLISRNANNLKTTRQSYGSGIPVTGNPMESVRVLASERRPRGTTARHFANGQPF